MFCEVQWKEAREDRDKTSSEKCHMMSSFSLTPRACFPLPTQKSTGASRMQCEELSAREEFTYSHMSTLERGSGTLGRRSDRGSERRSNRGERDSYTVDVRASDLQLSQPEPLKHPCFSYRAWLYSVLIGVRGKTVRTGPLLLESTGTILKSWGTVVVSVV